MKRTILEVLGKGNLTHEGLTAAVETKLNGKFDGSIPWYMEGTKLDLDELHPEGVDARDHDRCAERTHGVHGELMQILREIAGERSDIDRFIVHETVALRRDPKLV